jgi:hypothetical protein
VHARAVRDDMYAYMYDSLVLFWVLTTAVVLAALALVAAVTIAPFATKTPSPPPVIVAPQPTRAHYIFASRAFQ